MKKVYAEIIAGVIPNKMARNRWRGLLRYGFFNAIKLKYKELLASESLYYVLPLLHPGLAKSAVLSQLLSISSLDLLAFFFEDISYFQERDKKLCFFKSIEA